MKREQLLKKYSDAEIQRNDAVILYIPSKHTFSFFFFSPIGYYYEKVAWGFNPRTIDIELAIGKVKLSDMW